MWKKGSYRIVMTVIKKRTKKGRLASQVIRTYHKETGEKNMILAQLWHDFTQWSRSQSTEIDSSK